ncbi:hypothetical protein TNCV_3840861 [Trichonephila clavipes]|nr:hypothetical protein TNCV_3840861 [Trichonephila clavipes]
MTYIVKLWLFSHVPNQFRKPSQSPNLSTVFVAFTRVNNQADRNKIQENAQIYPSRRMEQTNHNFERLVEKTKVPGSSMLIFEELIQRRENPGIISNNSFLPSFGLRGSRVLWPSTRGQHCGTMTSNVSAIEDPPCRGTDAHLVGQVLPLDLNKSLERKVGVAEKPNGHELMVGVCSIYGVETGTTEDEPRRGANTSVIAQCPHVGVMWRKKQRNKRKGSNSKISETSHLMPDPKEFGSSSINPRNP